LAPLGSVGSASILTKLVLSHVDFDHPKLPSHLPMISSPSRFDPLMWSFVEELTKLGCISSCSELSVPTGRMIFRPKAGSDKLRAIFDCRLANAKIPFRPRTFSLPTVDSLKSLLMSEEFVYFHKTDILNCYWSIDLPSDFKSLFVFQAVDPDGALKSFSYNKLPFGWDFSPTIVNTLLSGLVSSVDEDSFDLVYIDDVLSVGSSPESCDRRSQYSILPC